MNHDAGSHAPVHQVQDLQKVLEISRAMVATEDLDGLLSLIVQRSMELLDAERATVFLYEAEEDELVSCVAAGAEEIRTPASAGIAGAAARSGQVINVPDAYADSRFNRAVDRQTGFRTRNLLAIPLRGYAGELVGVLQVLNKRRDAFDLYDISLAETLAAQAGVALQRARLIGHYLRKQEMERAMRIAERIQRGLLPKGPPQIPGFEVAGFSQPADETGGDTYDFMPLGGGSWMFVVADATGHGIGPALVIAETRAMLRAICLQGADATAVLETANNLLCQDLDDGRFVTCFLGVLNPAAAELRYASAGHGPMLFYHRAEDRFEIVAAGALPLGVLPDTPGPATVTHALVPGDFVVIVTDGFLEATNRKEEEFGVERALDLLRIGRDTPPEVMIEMLYAAVCDFAAGRSQADDLTAIVIRRL